MASEILRRNPTSTGNRRVFTWAGWVKINKLSTLANCIWYAASSGSSEFQISLVSSTGALNVYDYAPSAYQYQYITSRLLRDFSNWFHLVVAVDTTQFREDDRFKIYINGALYNGTYSTETTIGGINHQTRMNTPGEINYIGQNVAGGSNYDGNCELSDMFMVDGQALTPDVFGFYKQGKGYISVGSTQATDFRPGQWVPKTPRVIKTEINRRGGFGVNGFYLPMNDSRNFGADFHGDPNSIITLNEKLPQPRVGVATTASVGLGYTDALRADPYAANLVLALPFVSGGLSSGFGDYAPSIKGSGSAKTITNTNASIASTASYYGSAASFNGTSSILTIPNNSDFYFNGQFTIECWVNWNGTSTYYQNFIGCNKQSLPFNNNAAFFRVWGTSAPDSTIRSRIGIGNPTYDGSGSTFSGVALPTNQLIHVSATRDFSNTTRVFMNGVCVGIKTNDTSIYDFSLEGTAIGQGPWDGAQGYYSGYLQDLRVYKGVAKYTGGFDVPRPYTPVGIATWRAVPDTNANNFATLNPLYPVISGSNSTYTNGNLTVSDATSNGSQVSATIGVSTGKWYYEALAGNVSGGSHLIGIRPAEWFTFNPQNRTSYRSDGSVYNDAGGTAQSGTSYSSSDIIGVAIDMNTRKLWFSKNGSFVYSGNPSAGTNEAVSFASTYIHYAPAAMFDNVAGTQTWDTNFGQNPTFSGNTTAGTFTDSNGKGLFKYQPPSGFLALCEDNLPTPAISDPGKHFKTVLYTGDGNSGRSIVGVGFTPDLVWIKNRNSTTWHIINDSVRGPNRALYSNQTYSENQTGSNPVLGSVLSFNSDGFSLAVDPDSNANNGWNNNGSPIVAWCWRAGAGTTSTNTNGSVTSVVSVNQDAGFSIVSYTGNGVSNATVGHGLTKTPKMIILKSRTNGFYYWRVYHSSLTSGYSLFLNATDAQTQFATNAGYISSVSNTFTLTQSGANVLDAVNKLNDLYIAYCWAEIEGFSKFGSYSANFSADGPFCYCGFRPAFVIIKRTDSTGSWVLKDSSRNSANPADLSILAQTSDTEFSNNSPIDFLSNGFKLRSTSLNDSGATFIFAAWAESPFQTTNSK
ncbi:hypothetical protein PQC13_gp353 [Synechococcus phage S-SRM01]|uniref:B30.2/SPRY domain-containing protein n=1 Tax=Synechococcus phage S-SRM01 TaxID=2781608 RepID=A0A879R3W8_9CAUD|nr:hypothetical protein PQC13_gp353 [Synechococcus phage S-SRM01]QPX48318.1 hypothetical protein [Synechococcus phage S-SRM01]